MSAVPRQEIETLVSELPRPKGPGARLKSARISRKLEISDIARAIYIREDQVIALEEDDYEHLPGRVYALGYMKKFAREVGIPTEAIVKAFNEYNPPDPADNHVHRTRTDLKGVQDSGVNEKKSGFPLFGLVMLIVAGALGYALYTGKLDPSAMLPISATTDATDGMSENVPDMAIPAGVIESAPADAQPVTSAIITEPVTEAVSALPILPLAEQPKAVEVNLDEMSATATAVTEAAKTAEVETAVSEVLQVTEPQAIVVNSAQQEIAIPLPLPEVGMSEQSAAISAPEQVVETGAAPAAASDLPEILVTFTGDCWTDIRDSAKTFKYMDQARPGKVVKLSGTPPFKILFGNVSGVKMTINGEPFDLERYNKANVARFMLDPADL